MRMLGWPLQEHHSGHLDLSRLPTVTVGGTVSYPYEELAATRPLLLASLLVQEDLLLLRKPAGDTEYQFASGHAVFSFIELGINGERGFMAPGNKLSTIHSPVPGFKEHLAKHLTHIFDKLETGRPFWRANWSVAPTGEITPHETLKTAAGKGGDRRFSRDEGMAASDKANAPVYSLSDVRRPEDAWLKTEYQTIARVDAPGLSSDWVLFTVHTYAAPLPAVKRETRNASRLLADALRALDERQRRYRGVTGQVDALAAYLDDT